MSAEWERVAPGRYAAKYGDHLLQVIPNPDREDQRRYLVVIDQKPTGQPQWTLHAAKSTAMHAATRPKPKQVDPLLDDWTPPPIKPPPVAPIPNGHIDVLPPGVCLIRYKIQGEIRTANPVQAQNQLQAAIALLRELGVLANEIDLPTRISL